jgi:hypothetical protein
MGIVSHARKLGINLSLHKILQATSVRDLTKDAEPEAGKVSQSEQANTWFDLSAIQKFYFQYATQYKGSARFNQSITLRLSRHVEPAVIKNGLRAITNKHAMLRARFRNSNGIWEQMVMAVSIWTMQAETPRLWMLTDPTARY